MTPPTHPPHGHPPPRSWARVSLPLSPPVPGCHLGQHSSFPAAATRGSHEHRARSSLPGSQPCRAPTSLGPRPGSSCSLQGPALPAGPLPTSPAPSDPAIQTPRCTSTSGLHSAPGPLHGCVLYTGLKLPNTPLLPVGQAQASLSCPFPSPVSVTRAHFPSDVAGTPLGSMRSGGQVGLG